MAANISGYTVDGKWALASQVIGLWISNASTEQVVRTDSVTNHYQLQHPFSIGQSANHSKLCSTANTETLSLLTIKPVRHTSKQPANPLYIYNFMYVILTIKGQLLSLKEHLELLPIISGFSPAVSLVSVFLVPSFLSDQSDWYCGLVAISFVVELPSAAHHSLWPRHSPTLAPYTYTDSQIYWWSLSHSSI